jgi:hypothetical protein
MNMDIRRLIVAVIAGAPICLCAAPAGAQTIDFGDSVPGGPVAPGYAGFQWGTGANQAINYVDDGNSPYFLYSTAPAADIVEFSRTKLFDLNSVDLQFLVSQISYEDSFDDLSTVISGYRGTTLVKSVTENYGGVSGSEFTGLNIDGVNKITFTTTDTFGYLDLDTGNPIVAGTFTSHDALVDRLKVSDFHAAPEMDPGSAVAALTLLLGSLAVLRGRVLTRESAPSHAGTTRARYRQ